MGLAIVVAAALVAAAIVVAVRVRADVKQREAKMPHGADAALWSIVEAMPDPRNHLALTRDLTGEVRITETDRSLMEVLAQRAAKPAPQPSREPVGATP